MLSILIPTNNTEYIEPLFDSIDAQSWDGCFEVIVATDGCPECVNHLVELIPKYEWLNIYACPKNMGVYKTINTLLELSDGNDKLIFGSDDIMHTDLIKTLYEIEGDFKQMRFWDLREINGEMYRSKNNNNTYAAGAVWLNQRCVDVCGGYKSWRYSADSEYVERVKSSFLTHVLIDKELFWYRTHDKNLTKTVDLAARAKQRSQIKNNYGKHEIKTNPVCNTGRFVSN